MTKCKVHGGTEWRGGYCDKWSTDAGKGPCVQSHEEEEEEEEEEDFDDHPPEYIREDLGYFGEAGLWD